MYKRRKRTLDEDNQIKYTLSNVNLRNAKSTKADIITVIPKGSKVDVIDAEEDWYNVKYNNQVGYVYNEFLSKTMYAWTDASLRLFPTSESLEKEVIPSKGRLQVLENLGEWSKVIYKDNEGYVFNYFISQDGNPPDEYDYSNFGKNMDKFVNDNNIKSQTNNLIVTDLNKFYTYIYVKDENKNWKRLNKWLCTVGKKSTPTIEGTFFINGRKPYFGSDEYRVKYATRIKGSYYYHSILYDPQGNEVIDSTLGAAISHGCIRLETKNAHWIYDNILDTTTVVIH